MDMSLVGKPLDPENVKLRTTKIPLSDYLDSYDNDDGTEYPNTCTLIDVFPHEGVPLSTVETELRSIGVDPWNLPVSQHPPGSPYCYPWVSSYQAYLDRWRIIHWGGFSTKPEVDEQGTYMGVFMRVALLVRHSRLEILSHNAFEAASLMEEVIKERQIYVKRTRQIVVLSLSPTPKQLDLPMGWRQMDYLRMGRRNEEILINNVLGIDIEDSCKNERIRVLLGLRQGRLELERQNGQENGKQENDVVLNLRTVPRRDEREPWSEQQLRERCAGKGKARVKPRLPTVDEDNRL